MTRFELKNILRATENDMQEWDFEYLLECENEEDFDDEKAGMSEMLESQARHLLRMANALDEVTWATMGKDE